MNWFLSIRTTNNLSSEQKSLHIRNVHFWHPKGNLETKNMQKYEMNSNSKIEKNKKLGFNQKNSFRIQ